MSTPATSEDALRSEARDLDRADPLAGLVGRFVPAAGVTAYLDGNSLGRPLLASLARLDAFVREEWGTRLIRSWDEGWMEQPFRLGDRIAHLALGAAPGQTVVADSTTVLTYKLLAAAVAARPGRSEIVVSRLEFPTDRFVAQAIADQRGRRLVWIDPDPVEGVRLEDVAAAIGDDTAAVLLTHVDYRSGAIADVPGITALAREAGALAIWDLCHSAGVLPVRLDAWGVDLAVGCTYKYLNGGPGSPAFAYVAARHQGTLRQPIAGWMGAADVFGMTDAFEPAAGMRALLSGTPPIVGMLAMEDMLDALEEAGIDRVRAKSMSLTAFAVRAADALLGDLGVRLLGPRDPERRGGHVTLGHPGARAATTALWEHGVIPDFRRPDGVRLGLSPLSTSHAEVLDGIVALGEELRG